MRWSSAPDTARPGLAAFAVILTGAALSMSPWLGTLETQSSGAVHEFQVSARKYSYSPASIEVGQDDLVKITLHAEDIPHSFTIDDYRIAKRASPGHDVTFEFHASRTGTFPFYCSLASDEGCRKMKGQLVVRPR
jgi:heme/copper-type cytochrome/quinol oxidase subunit 2